MNQQLRPINADSFPKEPDLVALEERWFRTRSARQRDAPQMLVHCTRGAEGLLGMAGSGQVWATDVRFLNDRAEIHHGLDILSGLLQTRPRPSSAIGQAFVSFVESNMRRIFDFIHVFVVCLCQDTDLANQWFMYADHGRGFEVGFDLGVKRGLVVRDLGTMQTPFALEPITYDHDEQRGRITEVLDESLEAIERVRATNLAGNAGDLIDRAGSVVCAELAQRISVMKHRSFRNEHEWRFVYVRGVGYPENRLIEHRGPRGEVPFVRLDLRGDPAIYDDRLPLRQVLIGPHAPQEFEGLGIRDRLSGVGYGDPKVRMPLTGSRRTVIGWFDSIGPVLDPKGVL